MTCRKVAKTSKNTLASSTNPSLNPSVVDDLHLLEFKFINNGGHPDEVLNDQNFRNIIDYCIKHATSLKHNNFSHMGNRKMKAIQFASFDAFIDMVAMLLKKIRKWYTVQTVSIGLQINSSLHSSLTI